MFSLILYIISVLCTGETAKILGVFPTPSISHQVVFRPLMLELAKRGHEVTVITTDPAFPRGQAPSNLTEIDLHDISYGYTHEMMTKYGNEKDPFKFMSLVSDFILTLTIKQIESNEVQEFIKNNRKMDLLIVESFVRPAFIFSHIYDAPVIEFSSLSGVFSAFEEIGAAIHPFYYPNAIQRRVYNLTIWEKMIQLYIIYSIRQIHLKHLPIENKKLKEIFGPATPGLGELKKNVHLLFLNVHPVWDFNRPVPPNAVYLGGLHQKPQLELPKDLKSYLDSSKNGVIYISFGTNIKPSMFPPDKLKIFTDVAAKLPYDILWKWDEDELPGRSENVKIFKWLPQSDLLRHPKIKLFITQGGLQSTDEAITAAVPLVGAPMLGDQWFNVEQYVKFKIGKQVLIETVTEEQLMDAITTVINDKSYRENIVKLRDIMTDQPQSPLERAVWWTEHVLRHGGGAHLRAPAAHMSWTEYYELELVSILIISLVLISSITILSMCFIISKIRYYMRAKVKTN